MTKAKSPVPDGYHTVTPHLVVGDAAQAIEFYQKAFGAEETFRMPGPDGKVMHAEVRIGDSPIMLGSECPEYGARGPKALGGSPTTIHLYVDKVDAAFDRAVRAGCKVTMPLQDMFWGDRYGKLEDPFGQAWSLATHVEDLTPQEIGQRAAEAMKSMG